MNLLDDLMSEIDRIDKLQDELEKTIRKPKSADIVPVIGTDGLTADAVLRELQYLRQEMNNHVANYRAYQSAAKQREKLAEKRRLRLGLLSNIVSAIVGGLVVHYWPSIAGWIASLFH